MSPLLVRLSPLLLLLLLLSSGALQVVRAQTTTCSVELGDVNPTDFSTPINTVDAGDALLVSYTAPATQSINTLSIYISQQHGSPTVTLGIYDHNSFNQLATAAPISVSAGAAGQVYSAPLTGSVTSYQLTAGTNYFIAVLVAGSNLDSTVRDVSSNPSYVFSSQTSLQQAYAPSLPQSIGVYVGFPLAAQLCTTTTNTDASGNADPLFTGFLGQQFYIAGVDGQVMNILSTQHMQLNARLVQLVEGQSILPYEQDKLREWSESQHSSDPTITPAPFPRTIAWTHDGTYFAEAGVALLDDSRLYVKAGGYAEGWAVVTLNGRPLPVSTDGSSIVLGQGANTTHIQRVSVHTLVIRTVSVAITLVNSDHFLNVERVHLESGYERYQHAMGGILGGTVDASWSWNPDVEAANIVQSGDLFERRAVAM